MEPEVNPSLSPAPNPYTGKIHVTDTVELFTFQENQLNVFLGMGYVPYAVTMEPDPREEAQAKAKMALPGSRPGIAFAQKMWLRRERVQE